MLIMEIILTIFAWRKGWRWIALIPVGIAVLIGLIIGAGIGASGGNASDVGGGIIVIDIIAIIALIVMLVKGPNNAEKIIDEETEEDIESEEPKL